MLIYVLLLVTALLAFLCISHVIPEIAHGTLGRISPSEHRPLRKFKFPEAE